MPKPDKQMPKKSIKRTKLSDFQLKSEIISLFTEGKTGKTDLFGLIRTKFPLGRGRYFKLYDESYAEWAKLKAKGESEAIVAGAIQAAKIGLKSKLEKSLSIQDEIDHIEKQLRGESQFAFTVGNKIMKSHTGDVFMVPVQVQNDLRAKKLAYLAELNKMDGDYAPTKSSLTITNLGKDLQEEFE